MTTLRRHHPGDRWSPPSLRWTDRSEAVVTAAPKPWLNWYVEATLFAAIMPLVMVALAAGSLVPGTGPRMATMTGLIAAGFAWPFFAAIALVCRLVPEGVSRFGLRTLLLLPATLLVGLIVFVTGLGTGVYQG